MMSAATSHPTSSRLNVLFFTASLGGGGAEMHLLRLINQLDRQQFRPSLALTRAGGSYETNLSRDVPVHFLDTGKIASSTLQMLRSILPLRRLIQSEQPDLVCAVMGHANLVALLSTRGLPNPPKVVISVQNPPSIQSKNWLVKRGILTLLPVLYPRADRIIALSHGVAVDLARLVPQAADRIQVIPNAGFDPAVLAAAQQPLPDDRPIPRPLVVACGRLTAQKDFPTLLAAFAQVRRVLPAHLWIIGEGSQRQQLEAQIRELHLSDCVQLLGFQPNPFQWMRAADLFVLSSIYEGFGNVIVEAMACGTPVIATDCPSGPGEIIQHQVSGLLVPPRNAGAIAEAIVHVLSYPVWQQTLRAGGQQRAQQFHSQRIAAEYGAMFQSVTHPTLESTP